MNEPTIRGPSMTEPQAEGTRSAFHAEAETRASPDAIWRVWTDVARWPAWDTELESARLNSAFEAGATGVLKGRGNPESGFVIEAVNVGSSYRFVTQLPLGGRLVIDRTLTPLERGTRFRHDVRFEGFGGAVLSLFLGGRYREALPGVLARIQALAEGEEAAR
ncbi:MAG: SRPBCC family protein [Myxococcaceae bacterium]|nr:SRPBCC family protein [Myxococcaceae bacterium]